MHAFGTESAHVRDTVRRPAWTLVPDIPLARRHALAAGRRCCSSVLALLGRRLADCRRRPGPAAGRSARAGAARGRLTAPGSSSTSSAPCAGPASTGSPTARASPTRIAAPVAATRAGRSLGSSTSPRRSPTAPRSSFRARPPGRRRRRAQRPAVPRRQGAASRRATLEQLDELPGRRPGDGAEDRRLAAEPRAVPHGRRPRRDARDRAGAHRAAARPGDSVIRRVRSSVGWPTLLVAARVRRARGGELGRPAARCWPALADRRAAVVGAACVRGAWRLVARRRRARARRSLVGRTAARRARPQRARRAHRRRGRTSRVVVTGPPRAHALRRPRAGRGAPLRGRRAARAGAARAPGRARAAAGRRARAARAAGRRREGPRPASTSAAGSRGAGSTSCSRRRSWRSSAGGAGSEASATGCARTSRARSRSARRASAGRSSAGVVLGADEGVVRELQRRLPGVGPLPPDGGLAVRTSPSSLVGALALAWLLGFSRSSATTVAIAAVLAYALAVGWQPSVVRAGVAGCLASLAWLASRAARSLALPRARRARPARLDAGVAARAGVPAVVRRCRRDLRRRPAPAPRRRGLSGARGGSSTWSPSRSRAASSPRRSSGCSSAPCRSGPCPRTPSPSRRCRSLLGLRAGRGGGRARAAGGRRRALLARRAGAPPGSRCCARLVRGAALRPDPVRRGARGTRGGAWRFAVALGALAPGSRRGGRRGRPVGAARRAGRLVVAAGPGPSWSPPAGLRVTFLDVGQGDAVLLEVPQGAVLVDQGPPEARVARQLRRLGLRSLAAIVLTHPAARSRRRRCGRAPRRLAVGDGARSRATADSSRPSGGARRGPRARRTGRARACRATSSGSDAFGCACSGPTARDCRETTRTSGPSSCSRQLRRDGRPPARGRGVDGHARLALRRGRGAEGRPSRLRGSGPCRGSCASCGPRIAVISVGAGNDYGHPRPETLAALAGAFPGLQRLPHRRRRPRRGRDRRATLVSSCEAIARRLARRIG